MWTLQSTEAPAADDADDAQDDDAVQKVAVKGFSLPFDVVRRFFPAHGHRLRRLDGAASSLRPRALSGLLPVAERVKALFGEEGTATAADWIESDANPNRQLSLFPEGERSLAPKHPRRKSILNEEPELQTLNATTLDRLHAAMLLQSSGPRQRPAGAHRHRTGARPRFPGPRQRPLRPVPPR